jgi:hypothetical protein
MRSEHLEILVSARIDDPAFKPTLMGTDYLTLQRALRLATGKPRRRILARRMRMLDGMLQVRDCLCRLQQQRVGAA